MNQSQEAGNNEQDCDGRRTSKWRKKSRVVRKSSFERVPKGFFSVIRILTVDFILPNNQTITLNCIGNRTVAQIKEQVLNKAQNDLPNVREESDFVLTYKQDTKVIEICDLKQTFQTLLVATMWLKTGMKGVLHVSYARVETNEERMFNVKLGSLMGVIWGNFHSITDDELYLTRRKLTNVRRQAVAARNAFEYRMEPSLETCPLPQNIVNNLEDGRLVLCLYGPNKSSSKIPVSLDNIPAVILKNYFARLTPALRTAFGIPDNAVYSDYVLKVCGLEDYLWGNYRIIDFVYIRQCLSRNTEPNLALCPPVSEDEDVVLSEHDPWNLVDESTGITEEHQQLTIANKNHNEIVAFSMWDMTRNFRIKILGLDFLVINDEVLEQPDEIFVEATLYHGHFQLAPSVKTEPLKYTDSHRWFCWLQFDIKIRNIPKEARMNFNVIGVYRTRTVRVKTGFKQENENGDQLFILRWCNMQLLNHRSVLSTGNRTFAMWPMSYNEDVSFETHTATTAPNQGRGNSKTITKLHIELESYMHPVVFCSGGSSMLPVVDNNIPEEVEPIHGSQDWKNMEEILKQDRLHKLDDESQALLFKYRAYCRSRPNTLPKLLQSINAASLESVCKMHKILESWPAISVEVALELLDSQFVNEKVRAFATNTLKKLTNKKLLAYLLQLTQALKFEPYHDSALAHFLLTRSLQSKRIGHYFFWFLRSEVENPHVSHRYSVLLEAYLRGCGKLMIEKLSQQTKAIGCMKSVSFAVSSRLRPGTSASKSVEVLKEEVQKVSFPESFQAPYDPKLTLGKLNIETCKVMDSKKRPLRLEFENFDKHVVSEKDQYIRIMFKQGDDLRQDMLTLQMLSLMDQLWQEEGLDLFLLPYGCMSTGMQHGVIEVVFPATTVASIQKEFGGLIRGSFKDEVLRRWLEDQNNDPEKLQNAIKTFMLSCAGYCVATYVLGIGDRHNDNIMVTTSGNLFHIDFGHFLGNTKRFYGIQRERVPFVLTPDFVFVMGTENSEMFKKFKDTCVHAYLTIRRHAALFINLFHMMKSTGIPELTSVRDIHYLKDVLILTKSENEARQHFLDEIGDVLKKSWTVQVNWLMHALMHSGNS